MPAGSVEIQVVRTPDVVDAQLRDGLAACWAATANAGGAVGFPWPPVTMRQVHGALDELIAGLEAAQTVLVVAEDDEGVAGWVSLDLNRSPLVEHWATVRRLQAHPRARGTGVGSALMAELVQVARDELGLHQLHLAVRGGMGLEHFYRRLGWNEVGRWPDALRFDDTDVRDEVLMVLRLRADDEDDSNLHP